MNRIEIEQVAFERDDVNLFEDVSATWHQGEIVQLAGKNGCGKTTLMRCIAGIHQPSAGKISWNGHNVSSFDFRSTLLYLGHQVGIKLLMTPMENLLWYFGINGTKSSEESSIPLSRETLLAALTKVGLAAFADVPCFQLSAGQVRRAALARLYCSYAEVWLLDEPFTAIDIAGVEALKGVMEAHAGTGGVIIFTSHQLWDSEAIRVLDLEAYRPKAQDIAL